MQYKLQKIDDKVCSVLLIDENKTIPLDPANADYQAYLKWLSEGNEPLPAEE